MNGFEFDILAFLSAGKENAAVVIFLVLTLTYVAGLFGAQGRVQLGVALVLGFVLGGTFQAASLGWPGDYAGWFWLVIYALAMAVFPVLTYELGKELAAKGAKLAAEQVSQALGNEPLGRG